MVEFVNNNMSNVLSLDSLWKYFNVDFTYESMITENSRSTVDHFYVQQSFVLTCTDAGVLHHTHNTSDHSVIYVKFKCMVNTRTMNKVNMKSRPAWYKASYQDKTNYCNELSQRLDSIEIPINTTTCTDTMCNDHDEHIDRYCYDILECMLDSQNSNIPSTNCNSRGNRKPGWNTYVSQYHHDSMYWHIQWIVNGRPRNGYYAVMRNRSRTEYHKAVKYINRNKDLIKRINLLIKLLLMVIKISFVKLER